MQNVIDYIRSAWDSSVRANVTAPNIRPIPISHTVPSPVGKFKALFYWDTYFTNLGLLLHERIDLAKSNCDAFAWLVRQVGHVPNSAFIDDDRRSQPPYFSQMVREVFDRTQDTQWLSQILPAIECEYRWWMTNRSTSDGLNRHGQNYDESYLLHFYHSAAMERLKTPVNIPDHAKIEIAAQLVAEAETGWDFTPVFSHRCAHFASVHLNTLLWQMEHNLAHFCKATGRASEEETAWLQRASARADKLRQLLWSNPRGLFLNYDYVYGEHARIAAADTFAPLAAGLATPEEAAAVQANLALFECEHGIACTQSLPEPDRYQWAFPVSWPPVTWLAVYGLHRYGFLSDSRRIGLKYLQTMARLYQRDGVLWEKYDARTGEPFHGEYEADPMLGWSAGVFVAIDQFAKDQLNPVTL